MSKSEEAGLEQRVCYRCLIRDLIQGEDYEKRIGQYLKVLDEKDRADASLYEQRLETCRSCNRLLDGTCLSCGCYVEIRAAGKTAACPVKKW
ncbi:MAG: DUF6171 family protein [Lachnospiraceae bacterium]|nr:DUF6171 family protein [Lachnospiraceae bacterium]